MRIKKRALDIDKIHLSTYIIGLSFILGFTGTWILPNNVSNLIKPIAILAVFIDFVFSKKLYIDSFSKVLGGFILCISFSFCVTPDSLLAYMLSYCINIIYALFICMKRYNEKEFLFLLNSIKIASLVLSIVVVISNPLIGKINSATIYLFQTAINKNSIAYLTSPGVYVCLKQLFIKKITKDKVICILEILIMIYASIYPMSRGGFVCVLIPAMLLIMDHFKNLKWQKLLFYAALVVMTLFMIVRFLPEQYINRLLSIENYSFSNSGGRNLLIKEAVTMVKGHELFGRGFGYYQMRLGTGYGAHNSFVDIYVSAGVIGLAGLIIIFIYLIVKCRSITSYGWLIIALSAAFFESQTSYQLWVPIAMSWLTWKGRGMMQKPYCQQHIEISKKALCKEDKVDA